MCVLFGTFNFELGLPGYLGFELEKTKRINNENERDPVTFKI